MNLLRRILALAPDADTQRALRSACQAGLGEGVELVLSTEFEGFERALAPEAPPIVLVDVDAAPGQLISRLEPLVEAHPATRFIVLCREFQSEVVLEAMRVGARHCLVKSTIETDLCDVIRRLMSDANRSSSRGGQVLTVLSAGGGCGATTIAINLAEELRLLDQQRVLLVDLDGCYGAVGTFLGVDGQYGVVDVLSRPGHIDAELVRSTAAVHSDSLHVLLSPASIDFGDPARMPLENLDAALSACSHAYTRTVVDAPRVPMSVAAGLARASTQTLLVFELGVINLRTARAMIGALVERGVPRESILAVANRHRARKSVLTLEDVREALAVTSVACVSNDFEGALRSLNLGRPLAEVAPRSPMRKTVRDLAINIAQQYQSKAG